MHPLIVLRRSLALFLVLLLLPLTAVAASRVVAVGDIHADLDAFVGILQRAELIDAAGEWIGADAMLVQTGDFLDRGPRFREIMDLLMELEEKSESGGGRVVVLLGNHEVMNLMGDLRYVTPENYGDFADGRSEKRRRTAWKSHTKLAAQRGKALGKPAPELGPDAEREWMEKHPLGYFEQRDALGPEGRYGKWLREHATITRAGDAIFVHGGINPELPKLDVESIRERMAAEIAWFDDLRTYMVQEGLALPFFDLPELEEAAQQEVERIEKAGGGDSPSDPHVKTLKRFLDYRSWYTVNRDGPVWFRGFAKWTDEEGAAPTADLRAAFGAEHFVVGHSVTANRRIRMRFEGGIFLIDTGMLSSHYEGRASALEFRDGGITAIYPDKRVVLVEAATAAAGSNAGLAGSVPMAVAQASMAARDAAVAPTARRRPVPQEASADAGGFSWIGPDGEPLPFQSRAELVEFLKTAEIVDKERIKSGINQPWKVVLEKDGVRMNAVFRDVEEEQRMANVGGRREMGFRDSYVMEPAAYELSRMLGMDNVPPAALRKMGKTSGSIQAWIEGAMTERTREEDGIEPPDFVTYNRQQQKIRVFDNLIYNTDRNPGNTMIDGEWKLWAIDHTRAFRREKEIHTPPGFAQCEREFLDAIRALDEEEVTVRLADFLRKAEIKAIFQRRDKLMEYVEQLTEKMGEDRVLYSSQR